MNKVGDDYQIPLIPVFIGGPAHLQEHTVSWRFSTIRVPVPGATCAVYDRVVFRGPAIKQCAFFCWRSTAVGEREQLVGDYLCGS